MSQEKKVTYCYLLNAGASTHSIEHASWQLKQKSIIQKEYKLYTHGTYKSLQSGADWFPIRKADQASMPEKMKEMKASN